MSESQRDDQKWTSRASAKLVAMLNRADELGGELRDYLQDRREKMASDPRYLSARRTMARWLGHREDPSRPAPRPAAQAVVAVVHETSMVQDRSRGFGDPAIKAQIYGKRSCPWTGRAISLLERHKVDFDFVDLEEPEHEAKLAPLTLETRQNTVPYVYLRGKVVGGFNALSEIERLGQLEVALMSKDELAAAPAHVRAVEIVPRPNTDEIAPAEAGPPPGDSAG
ncbi:MAG TPA: glutaredoxin [Kofleriaceae bacterium]